MKKRIRYKKNAYKFHKRVLAGKRDASKDIVEKIECKIRRRFGLYKRLMNENRLEELTHLKLTVERMEALKDLYSYNSKAFRELKMELTTDKHNRISNLCPCCLLDIVGTLDHIIPKTPFPEYSTHPYNLIPCCSTCNSKKNDDWRIDGLRTIINFYVDDIPNIQFLYAHPKIMNGKLDITYSLSFPAEYDNVMRKRIENHFTRLDLIKRYCENTDDKISELSSEIKSGVFYGVTDDKIISIVKKNAHDMQEKFGTNYWVAILNIACVEDATVYNYIRGVL